MSPRDQRIKRLQKALARVKTRVAKQIVRLSKAKAKALPPVRKGEFLCARLEEGYPPCVEQCDPCASEEGAE